MFAKDDLEKSIAEIKKLQGYKEAEKIARMNSTGKVYLVGGSVYRTIARVLYGIKQPQTDFDFLVERVNEKLSFPLGTIVSDNGYGEKVKQLRWRSEWGGFEYGWEFPRFTSLDGIHVDLLDLKNVHSIRERQVLPTLENYLTGVPLTIQSIAFDSDNNVIVGEVWLQAIQERTVGVNNFTEAAFTSARSHTFYKYEDEKKAIKEGKYVDEYVCEKARSVGFKPIVAGKTLVNVSLVGFVGSESRGVRCAICHDDFKEDHVLCENKTIPGQYLHAECKSMLKDEVIDLKVTYGALVALAAELQQKEEYMTPQQIYERLQKEFHNPSVFRQVYTFFKKTFTREKVSKKLLKKE